MKNLDISILSVDSTQILIRIKWSSITFDTYVKVSEKYNKQYQKCLPFINGPTDFPVLTRQTFTPGQINAIRQSVNARMVEQHGNASRSDRNGDQGADIS